MSTGNYIALLYSEIEHNIVNQLDINKSFKMRRRKKTRGRQRSHEKQLGGSTWHRAEARCVFDELSRKTAYNT